MSPEQPKREAGLKGGLAKGTIKQLAFEVVALAAVCAAVAILCALLVSVFMDGHDRLSLGFLKAPPSRFAEKAGIGPALLGTLYLMILTAVVAVPLGVGAAVYLEEYARRSWVTRLIELNIANLAGVPSIVYGLLGLAVFVRALQLQRSLISGALTLALLILPIIITACREALRTVPGHVRQASLALGATKWQTIRRQVLPMALPGIMTGTILALSRAIGETAPIITIGAVGFIRRAPSKLTDQFTALPIQIYNWISRPREEFHYNAAAGIVVLLAMLLTMNAGAIWLRNRAQRRLK